MSVDVAKHDYLQHYRLAELIGTTASSDTSDPDNGNSLPQLSTSRKQKHKKHGKRKHLQLSKSVDILLPVDTDIQVDKINSNTDVENDVHKNRGSGDCSSEDKDDLISIDDMPDFSWLTNDFKFTDITDTFDSESVISDSLTEVADKEQGLSQRQEMLNHSLGRTFPANCIQDDRAAIEQEIRDKYAEIDVLISKIKAKRQRSKRRRKYQLRKYDNMNMDDCDELLTPLVNICPIKRNKRCAQPIRNAVLVRTAMRKACKGLLGSCCGKGCWASWKWISLRGVISDYE